MTLDAQLDAAEEAPVYSVRRVDGLDVRSPRSAARIMH